MFTANIIRFKAMFSNILDEEQTLDLISDISHFSVFIRSQIDFFLNTIIYCYLKNSVWVKFR